MSTPGEQNPPYGWAQDALERSGGYDTEDSQREIATAQVHATLALRNEIRRLADLLAASPAPEGPRSP